MDIENGGNKNLIPEEDMEFEQEILEKAKTERMQALDEYKKSELPSNEEKKERSDYERTLNDRKIELIKLKQGVIESSDTIKEVHEEKPVLTFGEKIENIWYRSKWLIIFAVFCVAAFGYIIYSESTSEKADLTVLVVMDNNALYARTEELEEFLEGYCEDLDGNGYVHVLIYNIVLDSSDPTSSTSAQAQIISQLQTGDNILIISDGTTDFAVHDFTSELSGDCVTEYGIRLNCALTREKLRWEAMPNELYIAMREPAKLLGTTEEKMQENFDEVLPMYERIYEDINVSEK